MTASQPQQNTRNRRVSVPAQVADAHSPVSSSQDTIFRLSKLELMRSLLIRPAGATLDELMLATGWQRHSVRAGLTGLRKRGLMVDRTKVDGDSRFSLAMSTVPRLRQAAA